MTQKEFAISCLERLRIYGPYVRKFQSKATIPCFFENFAGFYADQEVELWNKVKAIEEETGCLVYAITHEFSEIGETWSMLCVPRTIEAIEDILFNYGSISSFYAYAYVWNKSDDLCSEFGSIVVRAAFGGIKRVY